MLIASVIPIGLTGAIVAVGVTGGSINVMSMIGTVALLGIAVNDAIVKVVEEELEILEAGLERE